MQKYNAGLTKISTGVRKEEKKGKLFVPGVIERNRFLFPVDEINYNIGGIPVLWHNVQTLDDAKTYYRRTYPFLSEDVQDHLAAYDFKRKQKELSAYELRERQKAAADSFAI